MDPEASERLRKMQMADLGTDRREYVSTCDDVKHHASMRSEDIEAYRESNRPGTTARLLAQMNQEMLNEWTNLHKSVHDTGDLEDLEDILQGQSHRVNLSFMIQGAGARRGGIPGGGSFGTNHPRSAQSTGRGGGVIGARQRGSPASSRTLRYGGVLKPGRAVSCQDPALDSNNPADGGIFGPGRGRGRGRARGEAKGRGRSYTPVKTSAVRATRSPSSADYSSTLSSPEEFMASIRKAPDGSKNRSDSPTAPAPRAASVVVKTAAVRKEPRRTEFAYRPEISIPVSLPASTRSLTAKAPVSTSAPSVEEAAKAPVQQDKGPARVRTIGPAPSRYMLGKFASTSQEQDSPNPFGKPPPSTGPKASVAPKVSTAAKDLTAAKVSTPAKVSPAPTVTTPAKNPTPARVFAAPEASAEPKSAVSLSSPAETKAPLVSNTKASVSEDTQQRDPLPHAIPPQKKDLEGEEASEPDAGGVLLDFSSTAEPELETSPGIEQLKGIDFFAVSIEQRLEELPSLLEKTTDLAQSIENEFPPKDDAPADINDQTSSGLDEVERLTNELLPQLGALQKALSLKVEKALSRAGGGAASKGPLQSQVLPAPTKKLTEQIRSEQIRSDRSDEVEARTNEFLHQMGAFQKAWSGMQKVLSRSGGGAASNRLLQSQVLSAPTQKLTEQISLGQTGSDRSDIGEMRKSLRTTTMPVLAPSTDPFARHRSPARSATSDDSYSPVEPGEESLVPLQTPKKSVPPELMPRLEALRVSESPKHQTTSQFHFEQNLEPLATGGSTSSQWKFPALAPNLEKATSLQDEKTEALPLAQSVHVGGYQVTQYGKATFIGPPPFTPCAKTIRVISDVKPVHGSYASESQHSRNVSIEKDQGRFGVKTLGPASPVQANPIISDIMSSSLAPSRSLSQCSANAPLQHEDREPARVRTIGPAPFIARSAAHASASQVQESRSRSASTHQQASLKLENLGLPGVQTIDPTTSIFNPPTHELARQVRESRSRSASLYQQASNLPSRMETRSSPKVLGPAPFSVTKPSMPVRDENDDTPIQDIG